MNHPFVSTVVDGEVAVVTMNKPPVNGLGAELRSGIVDAIDAANANPAVKAIVLTGTARAFSGGADVTEFGTPQAVREPNLRVVITVLENSAKPVIAAIAGQCLGGGLELAMGAHFRVALADASLGLPEVKLGLLPGAGGTPRLIGVEAALNVIVDGAPVSAVKFKGTPLIDQIVAGDLVAGATAFARQVIAENRPLRRVRDLMDVPEDTTLRDIRSVGVIGAGTMGGGITMNFLNAGIPVALLETKQEALAKGLATIRKNYENSARKGKLTAAQVEERMALVTGTLACDSFRGADASWQPAPLLVQLADEGRTFN